MLSWYHLHSRAQQRVRISGSVQTHLSAPPPVRSRGLRPSSTLIAWMISSCGYWFFFARPAHGLHSSRPLSVCSGQRYSSDHSLSIFNCSACVKNANKKRPSSSNFFSWEGRRAAICFVRCQDFVVPPSFTTPLREQPLWANQTMCLLPDYGDIPARSTFDQGSISSRSFRVFFTDDRR